MEVIFILLIAGVLGYNLVREIRLELTRHCWHYLLRVARLPISPPAHVPIKAHKGINNFSNFNTEMIALFPKSDFYFNFQIRTIDF